MNEHNPLHRNLPREEDKKEVTEDPARHGPRDPDGPETGILHDPAKRAEYLKMIQEQQK